MPMRLAYFIGFFLITLLLVTSMYLQYFQGIIPCPLCTLQRMTFALLAVLFLVGGLLYGKRPIRLIINLFCSLGSLLGIFLAGRQIWLQHFPSPENTECGVSIQYMMQVLPMNEVLKKIFVGSTECSQRGWEFLHFNMAEWALLWFFGFLILSICLFFEEFRWHKN